MKMKKLLSIAAAATLLAACSDYDPGLSEEVIDYTAAEEAQIAAFESEFITRMGGVDENHSWGFPTGETRGTRAVNVNRNQWNRAIKENNQIVGYTTWLDVDGDTMVVPGFPSAIDGLYYIEENNKSVPYTEEQLITKGQDSYLPAGDVTDEEIQYVSEWFRSHPNPGSTVPKFTEFFIQDISQDWDRVSYPNGEAINKSLPVYVDGTLAEDGYWFEGGTLDNGTDPVKFGMDYFAVKTTEADWEHQNDFNSQKANHIDGTVPDNTTTFPERTLKYWTTNGGYTKSFMYHDSDDNQNYMNYVLVHLSFNGPRTGKHYDGYYLAFDYQFRDKMQETTDANGNKTYKYAQLKPDGYYSNWIVKLSPADPDFVDDNEPEREWHRIMCEDLGSTYDFDFNDLVFDVSYEAREEGGYTATIRLQAAGGTLPIYIGTVSPSTEAHYMLNGGQKRKNGTTYKPINVASESLQFSTASPYEFTLTTETDNPDEIAIYVESTDNSATRTIKLPSSGEMSLAPQKICIPGNTTHWMRESCQIETTYTYFKFWAQSEKSEYNFGEEKAWNLYGIENAGQLW